MLVEYGVRKFISAFLRCAVPKQTNKNTAGDEKRNYLDPG